MLAQLVRPAEHERARRVGEWQYERKLDGLRCVAVRNGDAVELWSRNRLSFKDRFPALASALASLAVPSFALDGEIVAFVGERASFAGLQRGDPSARTVYCAFDLLHLLGRDTTGLELSERKALLAKVLEGAPEAVEMVTGSRGEPSLLLRRACAEGWEGLVAKRSDAPYRAGRSGDWQKLKCAASQELVIGGWTDPSGTRPGLGALLVGYYDAERLCYAGKVGTGFDHQQLRELHRELSQRELAESPFTSPPRVKGAHWARPELVGEVTFTEWTADGRLRHPSFRGLRADKDAREVRRERTW